MYKLCNVFVIWNLSQYSCIRIIHRVKRGLCGNSINLNCVDPLGRGALLMAIDNENLQVIITFLGNQSRFKKLIDYLPFKLDGGVIGSDGDCH